MGNAPSESKEVEGHGVFGYCAGCKRALPAIKNTFEAPHFSNNTSDNRYEFIGTRHNEQVVYMRQFGSGIYKCKPCYLSWTRASGRLTNSSAYSLQKIQETFFGIATDQFMEQPAFADLVAPGKAFEFSFSVKPEAAHPAWAVVYNVVSDAAVVVGKVTLGGDVSILSGCVTHGIVASPANALPNLEAVRSMSDALYVNDSHALIQTRSETARSGDLKVLYTVSPKAAADKGNAP